MTSLRGGMCTMCGRHAHRPSDRLRQLVDAVGLVGADIENLIAGAGLRWIRR